MAFWARALFKNEVFIVPTKQNTYVSVLDEPPLAIPTRVLVELPKYSIVAYGQEARPVEHAGLKQAKVVVPFSAVEIFDEAAAILYLRAVMYAVLGKSFFLKPRVYLSQLSQVSPFMQELWQYVLGQAGAREVETVNPLLAVAAGAGLPINASAGFAIGWWDDDHLLLGLVAFGHIQYEQDFVFPGNLADANRDELASFFSQCWDQFLIKLPGEFRTIIAVEGGIISIANDDPILATIFSQLAGSPIGVLPRNVEILGMKKLIGELKATRFSGSRFEQE